MRNYNFYFFFFFNIRTRSDILAAIYNLSKQKCSRGVGDYHRCRSSPQIGSIYDGTKSSVNYDASQKFHDAVIGWSLATNRAGIYVAKNEIAAVSDIHQGVPAELFFCFSEIGTHLANVRKGERESGAISIFHLGRL